VGRVIASSNPSAGDDHWRQVSPSADVLPIFTIYTYRNAVYATVGENWYPNGYAVFKTDGKTPDPQDPTRFLFTPVVEGDGVQPLRARGAVSMQEFKGSLYVGTDRPTELIRINADDTWDLIVGPPRQTSTGFKRPLSGIAAHGFYNGFNGHFHSMTVHDDALYLGTWDWSQLLQGSLFGSAFTSSYGFDLFKSSDGIHWTAVDRNGLGDPLNSSVRNLVSTPMGLFLGAINHHTGLQIFRSKAVLDLSRDGPIDVEDVGIVVGSISKRKVASNDPRDLDQDRRITLKDAAKLATQCTRRGCLAAPATFVAAPRKVQAAIEYPGTRTIALTWAATRGAVRYHVFRADPQGVLERLPGGATVTLPGGRVIDVEDAKNGALDGDCQLDPGESVVCSLVAALKTNSAASRPFRWLGSTHEMTFTDTAPPRSGPALYYVVAENRTGRVSQPSAFVAITAAE
jgi:hypothetical protein